MQVVPVWAHSPNGLKVSVDIYEEVCNALVMPSPGVGNPEKASCYDTSAMVMVYRMYLS